MKKIIPSILITALASSSLLFAQVENRLEETKEIVSSNSSTNYELPTTNCNNQGHDLDCYLMMDPAELKNIEEGTKAVGEALGILGKEEIITAEGAGKGDIVNAVSSSNVSHQVLRLRGGGPKQKNKSTGGLKSTGESSDEENDPDLESEDT
ncbi:MAG TPA: hypothetical protein VJK54_03855, partial [Chthoniobacterales bacterium]|nr:hypothetical protein [Chthoniobacterales bacterium]